MRRGGGGDDCTYVNGLLGNSRYEHVWATTRTCMGLDARCKRSRGIFVRLVVRLAQAIEFTSVEQGWISILPALTVHGS